MRVSSRRWSATCDRALRRARSTDASASRRSPVRVSAFATNLALPSKATKDVWNSRCACVASTKLSASASFTARAYVAKAAVTGARSAPPAPARPPALSTTSRASKISAMSRGASSVTTTPRLG